MEFKNYTVQTEAGEALRDATVRVFFQGTAKEQTAFSKDGTPISELKTNDGGLAGFSAPNGVYDIEFRSGPIVQLLESELFFDPLSAAQFVYPDRETAEAAIIPTEILQIAYFDNGRRLEFIRDGGGDALVTNGSVSWSPLGDVRWGHFNSTARTTSQAMAAADRFARDNGRRHLIDDIALNAPVVLNCQDLVALGTISLAENFNPGTNNYVISYGQRNFVDGGRANVSLNFNFIDYIGRAAGTWDASSGAFPSGASQNDSYKVTGAGTVDGVVFAVGDTVRADIANPSTTTYVGNWTRRPYLAALRVSGVALGLARFDIRGTHCDHILDVFGNCERTPYKASGAFSHCIVRERSDDVGGGSPDNNTFDIRGASCGQWYVNEGTVLSNVSFDAQSSLNGYGLAPVSINAVRTTTLTGSMRVPQSGCIEIDQGSDARQTGVIFDNLNIAQPRNGPWLDVKSTGQLTGLVRVGQPQDSAAVIRRDNGSCLTIVVESQDTGPLVTFGDPIGLTNVTRSKYTVVAARHRGATQALVLDRVSQCDIEYVGEPLPVSIGVAPNTSLRLPSQFIKTNTAINGSDDAEIEFFGSADYADFVAYATPKRGMRGYTDDSLKLPVQYVGGREGWVVAEFRPFVANGVYSNSDTATRSGNGIVTAFSIPHGLSAAPTTFDVRPASADAAGNHYVSATATDVQITYTTAPPTGTNNLQFSWWAES
ncbi:hypothetical protein [Tateyamaria sp. ANG-S1]|uniref:hypothetical protein n=1 Tax=Tateyamaria sp. ANG-S1 TaxID=1577905 RepID=UPI00057C4E5D|nr:hypothetical protein [Tateyamaria sp. ANG-S1]KIC48746.1 hypothetical protein RA29_13700 [Tateyamaria sp. ANG-S1]